MESYRNLGQRLAAARVSRAKTLGRALSQAEVADAVGIARSTLASYERNHDKPGRDTLIALANFYNVAVDHLVSNPLFSLNEEHDITHNAEERLLLKLWRTISDNERMGLMLLLRSRVTYRREDVSASEDVA